MVPKDTAKHQPDANGNLVCIDNPKNYRVDIKGRNNIIKIANTNIASRVSIQIRGDDNIIDFGRCILKDLTISIGSNTPTRGASIRIGNHSSIEPGAVIELYTNFGEISIGNECLMSRNITFHFGDSPHLIFDRETGSYKDGDGRISIGNKVWIGEGVYLSKRANVADECIVAARSVVTRKFDETNCVIAGNPANIVKREIQWFRNRSTVPPSTKYAASIEAYDLNVKEASVSTTPVKQADNISGWGPTWPTGAACLFGIGAMKAGTSYIYDYLISHPDVHFGRQKEMHYFDVLDSPGEQHHLRAKTNILAQRVEQLKTAKLGELQKSIQMVENALLNIQIYKNTSGDHREYRNYLLDGYRSQKVVGDITPSYCVLSEERLSEMYRLAPSVKFLFVMRDPIDRLWSAVRMHAKQQTGGFAETCSSVAADIANDPNHYMLSRSDYQSAVEKLEAVAKPEDVHFMFYESMFLQDARDRLCDFLGIPHFTGSDSKTVNAGIPHEISDDIREKFYKILKPQYDFIFSRFGDTVPESWSN